MKAAIYLKYGSPKVVQLMQVPKPYPKHDELLIKIKASTVNRTDCGFRSAQYFISRFWSGLFKPKHQILGCEFAGTVEEIGRNVNLFKVGDQVFGYNDKTFGGHAEYLTIKENASVTTIPNNLEFEHCAAITEGAHYAMNIIKAAQVSPGQKVMVYGATGAIGSAAVQLLKAERVEVTAACNTKNVNLVRSLGADHVINHQKEEFTKLEKDFDLIFDAVGKLSFRKCRSLLAPKGIYISTELGKNAENIFFSIFTSFLGGKKVLFPIPMMNLEILLYLKDHVEEGKFKPVIDRHYHLNQIVEAHEYVDSGQKTGNVIIKF